MTRVNRKKSKSPDTHVVFIVGIMVLTVFMAAILMFASEADASNSNAKKGVVRVTDSIYKLCDGRNLIYTLYGNGIAVSPNDPQCY